MNKYHDKLTFTKHNHRYSIEDVSLPSVSTLVHGDTGKFKSNSSLKSLDIGGRVHDNIYFWHHGEEFNYIDQGFLESPESS